LLFGFDFNRQVSTQEGEAKAQELGLLFIETSAKQGTNIKTLFQKIASQLSTMNNVTVVTTEHTGGK
jgi:Ras-related protein Rab-6A